MSIVPYPSKFAILITIYSGIAGNFMKNRDLPGK